MKKAISLLLLISCVISMLIIPTAAANSPLGEHTKELDTTYRENAALNATIPERPIGFTPAGYGYGLKGGTNGVDGFRGYYSPGTTTTSTVTQYAAASTLGHAYFDIDAKVYDKNAPGAKYLGYITYQFSQASTIEVIRLYMGRLLDDGKPYNYMANGLDVAISNTCEAGSWKVIFSSNKIADDGLYQVYETEDGQKTPYIEAWFEPTEAKFIRIAFSDPSSKFATNTSEKRYFHINEVEAWTVEEIPEPEEEPVEEPAINSTMLFPLLMRHRQYETETTTTMFGLRVKHLLRSADAITFEKNGTKATIPADALKALNLAGSDKLVVTIVDGKVSVTVNGKAVDIAGSTPEAPATPDTPEQPEEGRVIYRWDFNDLTEKNGSGNLTDSERSTKGYSLKDGVITLTDRTTDFVLGEGFKLTGAYDWSIEWKADLEKGSALFGSTASANNFIYLAYETSGWKFPFRMVTSTGKAFMIPLGDYVNAMTEMNTWRAAYTAEDTTLTLKFYNESTKAWEVVGSVAMAGDYAFNITNLFGRYKSGTDVCMNGSVDYVQVSTIKEETAETELKDVHYRWDFNDLNGKDGKGNLTDSEKSTKSYTLKDGLITLTDRTTDFVMDQGFELADTYDWSIEWKAQLDNASSLFGTTASANNFVYLAYNVASWSNPVRITTDAGTSYMIPLGDYVNAMTEMNTWKLSFSAKEKTMELNFYDTASKNWEFVGSILISDPFSLKLTNLFGRYKSGTDVCLNGTVDYIDVVAKITVEK